MELDDLDPKQIKALMGMLSAMLSKQGEANNNEEEEDSVIKSRSSKVKAKKIGKKTVNLFDKIDTANLHKDDAVIDKLLLNKQPSPRMREFELTQVTCRRCGKVEEVSPGYVMDKRRYKCNECSGSAG